MSAAVGKGVLARTGGLVRNVVLAPLCETSENEIILKEDLKHTLRTTTLHT